MIEKQVLKDDFKKNGYVFIPGFLTSDEVDQISHNFNRYLNDVVPMMPQKDVFLRIRKMDLPLSN